jgi:hypothetical protein
MIRGCFVTRVGGSRGFKRYCDTVLKADSNSIKDQTKFVGYCAGFKFEEHSKICQVSWDVSFNVVYPNFKAKFKLEKLL